jgi:two-component system NtrC family response regulator
MKIAIVEDDINVRKSLEIAMSEYKEFLIQTFKNPQDALKKLDDTFDLIVTDLNMPKMDGIEFIKTLNGKYEVVVITGNATLQRAVESIKLGVKDFLIKPFEIESLIKAIKRVEKIQKVIKNNKYDNIAITENKNKKNSDEVSNNGFLGNSEALEKSLKIANRSAITNVNILLLGESGVGKEVFAKYIHNHSPRAKKPFIAINMAAIPEHLLESELFGYEKGAFTDATSSKQGQFELANGGTLFLDEIAEMPYSLQAKLLRVLQEREIMRLGSKKSIPIDIRLISATNANIEEKIKKNEFREDLYYRINTIPINIPPLRERKDEILQIANSKLKEVSQLYKFEIKSFSKEAENELINYSWPGNIRELLSVVERATILSEGNIIIPENLFLEIREIKQERSIADMERELISEVLNSCNFDKKESAKLLGMAQTVLERKIKQYRLL